MKKLRSIIIVLVFLSLINQAFGQQSRNFEIIEVRSDRTYYNLLQYNNNLYIGTSKGTIIIDGKQATEENDTKINGYISIVDGKLKGNSTYFGHIILEDENVYNYLLPDGYKNLISRQNKYNGKLYIINSGKLFLFKENNFTITNDSLSVRSITRNYIGSYTGIFKNGNKIKFPEYTDGYIREFDNETFICYEGLFRDSSGITTTYANSKKETVIAGKNIGFARDIQKLEKGNYALVTIKGIYLVNFSLNKIDPIIEESKSFDHFSIFKIDQSDKNSTRIFYTFQNKLFYYVIQTKENNVLLDTKHSTAIKQSFFPNTIDKIYVLFEDKLSLFTLDQQSNTYSEDVLMNGLIFSHNMILNNEKIFVSSNVGLHMFDLKKNKAYLNLIPVEINNRSLCIIQDTLKFGTLNGIYNLTDNHIESLTNEADDAALNTKASSTDDKFNYFVLLGIIILLIIIILIMIIMIRKSKTKQVIEKVIETENYGEATKDNIIYYIQENITIVTIQSIRDQFNLTPIMLYEILGNDKPGEIIRNYRMDLVRKYRRIKLSEEEIAQNTGFSISYLKKIY